MQHRENKVPLERYPRGPKKKRKIPAIAQGRLRADIERTQGEIDYALIYPHQDKEQQERIINRRKHHLKKLKEKMKIATKD